MRSVYDVSYRHLHSTSGERCIESMARFRRFCVRIAYTGAVMVAGVLAAVICLTSQLLD